MHPRKLIISRTKLASFRNHAAEPSLFLHLRMSYQNLLEDVHVLVGNGHAVDLPDFVADVEGGLPVDHAAVHDARYQTAAVVTHLQRDPLYDRASAGHHGPPAAQRPTGPAVRSRTPPAGHRRLTVNTRRPPVRGVTQTPPTGQRGYTDTARRSQETHGQHTPPTGQRGYIASTDTDHRSEGSHGQHRHNTRVRGVIRSPQTSSFLHHRHFLLKSSHF